MHFVYLATALIVGASTAYNLISMQRSNKKSNKNSTVSSVDLEFEVENDD